MLIELTLPTMTCGHCVRAVTEAVRRLDPRAQVQVDLAGHRVQVTTDRPVGEVAQALADEGYAPA